MDMDPKKLQAHTQRYFKITEWIDAPTRFHRRPSQCEDCDLVVTDRRVSYKFLVDTQQWLKKCSGCREKTPVQNPFREICNK